MIVQSILFEKKYWNIPKAIKWLDDNKFKFNKLDTEQRPNFLSFRQQMPLHNVKYYTKKLKNHIDLIIMTN